MKSPPSRGRGLEPYTRVGNMMVLGRPPRGGVDWNTTTSAHGVSVGAVAPLAGAWIGTLLRSLALLPLGIVAPLAGAWIGTVLPFRAWPPPAVAPLAGAWIGTVTCGLLTRACTGRPPRGGVDWNARLLHAQRIVYVAPLAGAWIGTLGTPATLILTSRPPRGGVDWNNRAKLGILKLSSRPPRGGVDWNWSRRFARTKPLRRPPRGGVDWNKLKIFDVARVMGRPPRGGVDWNCRQHGTEM